MEEVCQWLIGLTCAALLAALAEGIMPKGATKQIGKLVCALVLLAALLAPLKHLRILPSELSVGAFAEEVERQQADLEQSSGQLLKTLIERESAAYIVDKAAGLGLVCQAQVICTAGEDGTWIPHRARITGRLSETERAKLSAAIQNELGIAWDCQEYAGGEEVEMERSGGEPGMEIGLGSL